MTLINRGENTYSRHYWSDDLDFKVYSKKGKYLGSVKRGGPRLDMEFNMYLEPGKERTKIREWEYWYYDPAYNLKRLKPGKYELAGIWRKEPIIETSRILIEIKTK